MAYTLEISPDFTIEDIHKIRERNYEITKNMTIEEKLLYYNTPRSDAEEQIERLRAKRTVTTVISLPYNHNIIFVLPLLYGLKSCKLFYFLKTKP